MRAAEGKAPEGIEQANLVLRARAGAGDTVYWDAQWRNRADHSQPWRLKKKRLGRAWLELDQAGDWQKRKGRCREGWLDERAAPVAVLDAMSIQASEAADQALHARLAAQRSATVRGLAEDWLHWLERIRGVKPSTVRDYRTIVREAGQAYQRGTGKSRGRIMATFGDALAAEVTTAEVSAFLRKLDDEGLSPRNVNKHRQVLQAMFSYAGRSDTLGLDRNPVDRTDKRREPPPAALDYYEVEEIEALARVCETSAHRRTWGVGEAECAARVADDRQDAEAFRVLFYTGVRVGELVTLRWSDVDLDGCSLLVRRTLSADAETLPKGGRSRRVPLSDPARAALARLGSRAEFVGDDDYVVCNRYGRRLDVSALRRHYNLAAETAGLRPVKLHGLRHAAGSILAREADPVFVRDFLGHAKLSTTDRYVSAKHRPEDLERLNRAFGAVDASAEPAASIEA
ncbi:MAG: tyrosine-type recombinase/integrase [Solirubrobacteraceae bacterium]